MLTDTELRSLRPKEKAYKMSDRDGMYVMVTTAGTKSFRYDYRLNGRRETLTIGKYDDTAGAKHPRSPDQLEFGMTVSLAEARSLLTVARRYVERGQSPAKTKALTKQEAMNALTFASWAERYFEDKADPNNGAKLADSTLAMRRSVYTRYLLPAFGRLKLDEITPALLMQLCEKIKKNGAPAPAVHVREITLLVYRFALSKDKTLQLSNPAADIRPSDIASFKPRDRALSPNEIKIFFESLEKVGTIPTLRLAIKFILLTMVRKGEFIGATWDEVDFDNATWIIPKERMKASRPHVVYLSNQALDILVSFKSCFSASKYLHPGRYDSSVTISNATLNRVIDAAVKKANELGHALDSFTVHDLRRTASSLLNEFGFNRDWIEKCLAHEENSVRSTYNKAEYSHQRRVMLQAWADIVDCFINGRDVGDLVKTARIEALNF
ncbi:tyrosine-type recombinase/integrase [Comamonas aquatica]|uniref:tyrosine-type recombinase/integrase n=1 Tax=Comamonas aquatica TaxID=225991 RepID=UPI002449D716|nr:site-specific integrase [Comamonas aquatica]MDH0382757.1 tyrosine-type recombinase/integrase [Comamonas aquatica]MDH0430881.1 tyrosine-type recombinase/integrase [Comamonas aquatica]MDH0941819.1 tyrosine-type recombinase/integrase [Comamonas aquatica]